MKDYIMLEDTLRAAKEYCEKHPDKDRKKILDTYLEIRKLANELLAEGWTREEIIEYSMLSDMEVKQLTS